MPGYDGQVVINTKLDDKGLKQGITGLQNTSVNAINKVKGVLAAAGITLGVAAAVKGLNNMIKATAALTDDIDKQSQKLGMSRQAYQEWGFILSQNGSNIEGMTIGMKTLSQRMDEAMRGVEKGSELFDRLGISIDESMSQEDAFEKTVRALQGVENQIEKAALAQELFGRSGQDLLPMLNQSRGSIDELREAAYDLGLILEDDVVDAGVHLTDTFDQMKRAMQTASARAISPLLDDVDDLAGAFTENVIPKIESFLSTAIKVGLSVPVVFQFMKTVVTKVLEEIGTALAGPWDAVKGFAEDLLNLPVVQDTISLVLDLAGDLYNGLKKGVQSGDWSDFWSASIGVAKFAIGIFASLQVAGMAGTALFAAIQKSLGGAGFSTAGLAAGAVAMLSVGIALKEAMDQGNGYAAFAQNMAAAIAAGFLAALLTADPAIGAYVGTIVLNLRLGTRIGDFVKNVHEDLTSALNGGEVETIFGKAFDFGRNFRQNGLGIGDQFYEGMAEGLLKLNDLGIRSGGGFLENIKKALGIHSPSKEGEKIGEFVVQGLESGLEGMAGAGTESASEFMGAVQDELGVHSKSKEGEWIGFEFINGLLAGLVAKYPELEADVKEMVETLERIWAEGDYKTPIPDGTGGTNVKKKTTTPTLWEQIGSGWDAAQEDIKNQLHTVSAFVQQEFSQIPSVMSNAIGAGMRSLGEFFATQKEQIADLKVSIKTIQGDLEDAYDDLQDAQEEYADAVLSGDKDAIEAAQDKIDQQNDSIAAQKKALEGLQKEKEAVESGSKAWNDFAKVVLGALSDELYGLGARLAAEAIGALLIANWTGAALAAAGSAAAFGAAMAVDSWAGSYADGGVVPYISGIPATGDRLTANVNPGELILNQAQQDNLAAQLAEYSRISEAIGSFGSSTGSVIHIHLEGSTYNSLNEDAVGRAIYRNIKTLQKEGVLKAW